MVFSSIFIDHFLLFVNIFIQKLAQTWESALLIDFPFVLWQILSRYTFKFHIVLNFKFSVSLTKESKRVLRYYEIKIKDVFSVIYSVAVLKGIYWIIKILNLFIITCILVCYDITWVLRWLGLLWSMYKWKWKDSVRVFISVCWVLCSVRK